jgi:large subunit ribosomal protein L25
MEMNLKVQVREKNEKLASDFMAGVVYGQSMENVLIKIKTNDFIKVYGQAGESNLINLEIEGNGTFQVLVKEVQKDVVKDFFIHVDFYKVDMSKELTAEIPLEFVGESKAIKEQGALLNKSINEVSVECLPQDLVDHIDIDISVLVNVGDAIFIKDINVPKGIKILNNADDVVATVTEQVEEKVEAPAPTAPTDPTATETPAKSAETDKK